MGQARPTFERRQLGLTLRRLREGAARSQQAAADALGKVRSRIVQLEDGTATASQDDLEKLLDYYGVVGAEREGVVELGAQARKRQMRRSHIDMLPAAIQRFADLEANAREIDWYDSGIVPGLLQAPGYAKAIFEESRGVTWASQSQEGDDRLAARLERQARVFNASQRQILRFVMTEDALFANLGHPDVTHEQLLHLLSLLDEHRDLTVRVLRNDAYGNPSRSNSFGVFRFGDRSAPIGYGPVVLGPATYYDREDDVAILTRMFYRIWELSLSRADSRRFIETILKETLA